MTAFLTFDRVSLSTPDGRSLVNDLTIAFGSERTGLVGRNGSGKSTLLRIACGQADPALGVVARRGSTGLLDQILDPRQTIAEALGVDAALAVLQRMEDGSASLADAAIADWGLRPRLEAVMAQTGLLGLDLRRPVAGLSGGQRTRVALARLYMEAPDLLLLDEPTNNLDSDGRAAVADLVRHWRGGVVVASHDRTLLEPMDRIVELAATGVTIFGGGWSEFAAARDGARRRAAHALDEASQIKRQTERAVQHAREKKARRDSAGRASRVGSSDPKILLDAKKERAEHSAGRETRLADRLLQASAERLDFARARVEVLTPLDIDLPKTHLPGERELVTFDNVAAGYEGHHVLGPLTFQVRGPARLAIRGRNGSGKSTLLKLLAGELRPMSGRMAVTERMALLDQHVSLLDDNLSVAANLRGRNPGLSDFEARSIVARFAFRNRAADQVAKTLSGGERLRAGLACTFARPDAPWLLLLDEPTNHLDLDSLAILETALSRFDGAMIVVSHDESFLGAIGVTGTIDLSP